MAEEEEEGVYEMGGFLAMEIGEEEEEKGFLQMGLFGNTV